MSAIEISLVLGIAAGVANVGGGLIVVSRPWSRTFLTYFIALGAGFMLATALMEIIPESIHLAHASAPLLILLGYLVIHFFEHSLPAHFHFGEETHAHAFLNPRVAYTALGGLLIHTFFDGVAIASGFLISTWLGVVIFGAIILHNVPEGFTMASIMMAARKSRAAGLAAVGSLGVSRIIGILAMAAFADRAQYGLALSGGVTLYVAASDLIPEVNQKPGLRFALAVAVGVILVVLVRMVFFPHAAL
ncbi:MAG: ZIP family metal transporter [Acidobacteriota bacterium]|nr:ZIP family metal transporter [Acidobacteriota bacterium]